MPRLKKLTVLSLAAALGVNFDLQGSDSNTPSPKELAEQEQMNHSLQTQRYQRAANNHFRAAQRLYNLERYLDARDELKQALIFVPEHPASQDLLTEINALLGESSDLTQSVARKQHESHLAHQEQARRSLESQLNRARDMLDKEQFEQALSLLNRIRASLGGLPVGMDVSALTNLVDLKINEAESQKKRRERELISQRALQAREQSLNELNQMERLKTKRIQQLMDLAWLDLQSHKYRKAERGFSEVLKLDPSHEEAARLREKAFYDRINEDIRKGSTLKWESEEELKNFVQSQYVLDDPNELIKFPENFQEVTQARIERMLRATTSKEASWKANYRTVLSQKDDFVYHDTLQELAESFKIRYPDLTFIFDIEGEDPADLEISLDIRDVPLQTALEWIAKSFEAKWLLKDYAVYVTTDPDVHEDLTIRSYDINDLTIEVLDYPGPQINLASGEAGITISEPESGGDEVWEVDEVIEFLKESTGGDDIWVEPMDITERPGSIVVSATPELHTKINDILTQLRDQRALQVQVQTRFLKISDLVLDHIGVDFRGLNVPSRGSDSQGLASSESILDPNNQIQGELLAPISGTLQEFLVAEAGSITSLTANNSYASGFITKGNGRAFARGRTYNLVRGSSRSFGPGAASTVGALGGFGGLNLVYTFLSRFQAQAILNATHNDHQSSVLDMPMITCFNTQRATVSTITQQAYVQDVTAVVAVQVAVFDPEIGYLTYGTVLDVRPIVSHDRKYIQLEMQPAVAEFTSLRQLAVPADNAGISGTSNLELPEVNLRAVHTTVSIPDGGVVMIGGLSRGQEWKEYTGSPFLSRIPILNFFAGRNYRNHERVTDMILVRATLIDQSELEEAAFGVSG